MKDNRVNPCKACSTEEAITICKTCKKPLCSHCGNKIVGGVQCNACHFGGFKRYHYGDLR